MRQEPARQDRKTVVINADEDQRREDRRWSRAAVRSSRGFAVAGNRCGLHNGLDRSAAELRL
jgi:hypothetical protein